jgi:DNA integrity scanning protein DisA with diadenylate cyclase activity
MGCLLPLSERQDLPVEFGTRHRAAFGISELTDAVCLVVSEERSEVTTIVNRPIHGVAGTRALGGTTEATAQDA